MNNKKLMMGIIIALSVIIVGLVGIVIAVNVNEKNNGQSVTTNNGGDNNSNGNDISAAGDNSNSKNGDSNQQGSQEGSGTANQNQANGNGQTGVASTNHTAKGTSEGNGYEGIEGTGKYNYGEALQKSLIFYELQRSGALPEETRCNWRGDSCLNDGSDNGLDLTGGWFDAGDNVKFNLPMAYSAAMLGWSIYEDRDAYVESGQLEYALANVKWANDYFIKCHPEDEVYYYQVGSGSMDHTWWGSAELVETRMDRPSYKVTKDAPGSTVTAETAASLAVASIIFKDTDPEYSKLCLSHAKSLYAFSDKYKSDDGYTEANGFYNSWSGYYDELAWAGAWLYIATGDKDYLTKAEAAFPQASDDYKWAMCWDDVHVGAAVLLADLTGKEVYKKGVEDHLDYWTTGTKDGERITYTPKGLAWLDSWGSIRYATTTAFIAAVYSEDDSCTASKRDAYWNFAVDQVNYALGDTGFSYMIGFGDSYPEHPHHRTSQGSYADNMNEPGTARHTLYGALVGGPDANDGYTDEVSNYNTNEVACDYNAGFTGILAKLYSKYHGKTIIDFGAVEEPNALEFYADAGINVTGQDFVEIRAFMYNCSAWPARSPESLELRYFVDLSEIYEAGGDATSVEVTTNYMRDAVSDGLKTWDEEKHIYYLSIIFDGNAIYPGGQEQYKKEVQVRLKSLNGVWDDSNDPSFEGLTTGSVILAEKLGVYEDGVLVFGTEPPVGDNPGQSVATGNGANTTNNQNNNNSNGSNNNNGSGNNNNSSNNSNQNQGNAPSGGSATAGDITVKMEYQTSGGSANSISGNLLITNNGSDPIKLSELSVKYYFTNDASSDLAFSCYHASMTGKNGDYHDVSSVNGTFSDVKFDKADKMCLMTVKDSGTLEGGATVTINFCINHNDWSNFNLSNDYSGEKVENIVVLKNSKVIFGNEP